MILISFNTKNIKFYLLRITFLSSSFLVSQNQVSFRQLSIKEGLSQNSAISITQDQTGFLWIATQDGLNKYDGRRFTIYPFDFLDITKSNYSNLGKVYTDRNGNVWIIPTNKILHKYDSTSDTFKPISDIKDVSILYQDEDYNYWVGTYNKGLYLLDSATFKSKLVLKAKEINGPIYEINQRKDGTIILTTNKKIIELNPQSLKATQKYPKTKYGEAINENFSAVVIDNSERQWFGTYGNGLYFKDKKDEFFHRISELLFLNTLPEDLNIIALHIDSKERLWIATYGNGLYLVNLKNFKITHFTPEKHDPRALHYNDILSIYEDYSGTLWFGSDGAGLSYYDEYLEKFNSYTSFQIPYGINIDVIRAITVSDNGNIWLGTSGKGLTQYEPAINSWRTFNTESTTNNTISSDRIMSLLIDHENELWIGTQEGGLNILDQKGHIKKYSNTSKISLSATTIWCIFKGSDNKYWLGTREHGLIQFDKRRGEIKRYTTNDNLSSNNIRVITQSDSNHLWLGTEEDGIVLFDILNETFTSFKSYPKKNSLSNNKVKSLYYDPSGILWVGTKGGGLNKLDIKKNYFHNYTTKDGLANDVIYGILPDKKGNLWLSSNKGISKFTPENTLGKTPSIVNYNNYDGLATEFNTGAYFSDSKGNLYFGGLDGFYWFQPDHIAENKILPKTTITGFEVFGKSQVLKQGTKLDYNQNTLSFIFSSLQYSMPEKNMYQYKLSNYDNDWVHAGNNNFARYTQIPPGDYEFQVKSSNYDGLWNKIPETFKFSIASPWYLTNLAKVVYLLLILAIIFGIYSYLKWLWRMQLDLKLKEEEAERFRKLNDFKSKLYADISHEFRTPLTLISGPIDSKLGEGNISDSDYANFSMIKRNTNRLLSLVDQLLDLAKLDKGKLKLKITKGNLGLFLHTIVSSFDYKADIKKINYNISIEPITNAWYDEDVIEKILTNILSNAFKYCPEQGMCYLSVTKGENNIIISSKNTAENLSELQIEKLFTRFYQKDEYAEGAGVGLSLVKKLVQLCHGEISANLENENTIQFLITLPIDKASFNKNYIIEPSINQETIRNSISNNIDTSPDVFLETKVDNELPILLLVEDHVEIRQFIKLALKHKYKIFEAENGIKGIKVALEIVPDIIISDIRMPKCSGIELCNTLKNDERTSHIPIILLTAGIGEENELKGLQSGADDFIIKPFKLRILEKRIANLIEVRKALRNRYSQELILKAKDISITPTDEVFLNKVQQILDKSLSNPDFNTEYFSKEVAMSRMQLHRKLLVYTGLSTSAFIRSQRLKQALHILNTSDATINEVAYMVGFNTPSYFIKCFKETYNNTPAEYLQSLIK
ncbi:two-component regulator propeller domain-containing protein [Yeosuana marina]|uniref:two-component regulator propeller domain-containing protein n=1 Tax=Yeosuana marina TaxID=1565536 RepID=UPI001423DA34|nr:two-component regulator propeller domain-containing protein [Yeosuana marina]